MLFFIRCAVRVSWNLLLNGAVHSANVCNLFPTLRARFLCKEPLESQGEGPNYAASRVDLRLCNL